jgi:uncharacterized membrane protein
MSSSYPHEKTTVQSTCRLAVTTQVVGLTWALRRDMEGMASIHFEALNGRALIAVVTSEDRERVATLITR